MYEFSLSVVIPAGANMNKRAYGKLVLTSLLTGAGKCQTGSRLVIVRSHCLVIVYISN